MKIVLTGFGPFGNHETNASWQGVQAVPQLWNKSEHNGVVDLVIEEVPVSYDYVKEKVPDKWNPVDFVVHVGVSSIAECITLETCAYNYGYQRLDINAKCPLNGFCKDEMENEVLKTCLNVDNLCQELNQALVVDGIKFVSSCDAGRYLCEFIYYSSLAVTGDKSLFVHVPCIDKPYSQEELGKAIFNILDNIVKYLKR